MAISDRDADKLVERFRGVFATKDDFVSLKGDFVSLKGDFVSLEDRILKRSRAIFATKDELKSELKSLENRVFERFRSLEDRVVEFLDHIVKRQETLIQEQTMANAALRRHDDKLENHEGRLVRLEGVAH